MTRKVAIFGCGPAGLLAAHACALAGVEFVVLSRKEPSRLYGAQFLSEPIPGIPAAQQEIHVTLNGTVNGYRKKVYGPDYAGPVSPQEFVGRRTAHDIRSVYRQLWEMYSESVEDMSFSRESYKSWVWKLNGEGIDIFSSIPAESSCVNPEHAFDARLIYAIGDAPDLEIRCPIRVPPGHFVYSGQDWTGWYRAANVFEHCTVEWPARKGLKKPPLANIVAVRKPLSTNCTCYPNVHRIGRYGEWKKGVLAHSAFDKTVQFLTQQGVQGALF
jgi:hypothetical protein